MTKPITRSALAKYVDHTLLATDATPEQIDALYAEARELEAYAVCVSPNMLPIGGSWVGVDPDAEPARRVQGDPKVATVIGFPSGKHHSSVKVVEAARALGEGADELDMVIDIGMLKAGLPELVEADIAAVRRVTPAPALLKVIIEAAALTDAEIVAACEAAKAAGADFVKTSTGFHNAGGASVHAVALMRATVGDALGVKASGGIRTYADAVAMIEAGATRLGMSATRAVLAEAPEV